MLDFSTQYKLGVLQGFVVEMDISSTMPAGLCGFDSEWQSGGIFKECGWEPWVRRLGEMPFQKQLERHFSRYLFFALPPQLLPDGTELLRHIRIGHRTGDIHRPGGFGSLVEPAFILHGLQRVL